MNTFGDHFIFTSFGESHGKAIGGVLDGVPAGIQIDMDLIRAELDRRSGRGKAGTSPRAKNEADEVEWLSGVLDGVTLGTPIAFIIRNTDIRPEDYEWMKTNFRPGHADFSYQQKYGIRDWRGGGRSSARETVGRVVAGCIAKQLLSLKDVHISASLTQLGAETDPSHFEQVIHAVQEKGDSIGGIVTCHITGLSAGVGEPIFDKLTSHLAFAMLSINGCQGFDYSYGFTEPGKLGSERYFPEDCNSKDSLPVDPGIAGGISTGADISFRVVFKPAATIAQRYKGRHDACIAVRAIPIVEAMTALTIINMR